MGHGQKNANRGNAIAKNTDRAETNRKAIAELRKEIKGVRSDAKIERLKLERHLLGEIENVAGLLADFGDEFDLHRRPWYRKAIEWTRATLRLDYVATQTLLERETLPVDHVDDDEPHYLGAIEISKNEDELDPDLGKATKVELSDDEETDPGITPDHDIFDEALAITEDAVAAQVDAANEQRLTVDELVASAGDVQADEDERKKAQLERMYNPERILERLEYRLDAERENAGDIMENQELDQEEKAELLDRSMDQIEEFEARISHQKLVIAGFAEAPK